MDPDPAKCSRSFGSGSLKLTSTQSNFILERIVSYPSSVGSAGDSQTLFLAVVEDADRVADGGGLVEEVSFIISVVPLVQ